MVKVPEALKARLLTEKNRLKRMTRDKKEFEKYISDKIKDCIKYGFAYTEYWSDYTKIPKYKIKILFGLKKLGYKVEYSAHKMHNDSWFRKYVVKVSW